MIQVFALASPAESDPEETRREDSSEASSDSDNRARPLLFISIDLTSLNQMKHESGSRGPVSVLIRNLVDPRPLPEEIAGDEARGSVLFATSEESEILFAPSTGSGARQVQQHDEWRQRSGEAVRGACEDAKVVQARLVKMLTGTLYNPR
mmetsp:Transcript_60394/g.143098  ORF Transcript_60394/g.143098 Transcript_60394/m.143098 type:complete len:150 (+) Transcript_60394:3-452(+)